MITITMILIWATILAFLDANKDMKPKRFISGAYVLSKKDEPVGANYVEFKIKENKISINGDKFRPATESEIQFLLNHPNRIK